MPLKCALGNQKPSPISATKCVPSNSISHAKPLQTVQRPPIRVNMPPAASPDGSIQQHAAEGPTTWIQ